MSYGSKQKKLLKPYEASTTSLPQGEIDIDPTGNSTWKVLSSPNVGLSKAEAIILDLSWCLYCG